MRKWYTAEVLRPMSDAELQAFLENARHAEQTADPPFRSDFRDQRVAAERELRKRAKKAARDVQSAPEGPETQHGRSS